MSTKHQQESRGSQARLGGVAYFALAAVGGVCVFAGLALYMHAQQSKLMADTKAAAMLNASAPPPAVAEVASAVAAMKLVTVEIDTKVRVQRGDSSWRGDVVAAVELPVRLSFGVDLSQARSVEVGFSTLGAKGGTYIVSIPPPRRIATQVMTERVPPELTVGWLRLRSIAGEYYISQARKDAPRAAMELELLPADALRVQEMTLEQVRKLVRTLTGRPDAEVVVRVRRELEDDEEGT
jgi:hypothetical protein